MKYLKSSKLVYTFTPVHIKFSKKNHCKKLIKSHNVKLGLIYAIFKMFFNVSQNAFLKELFTR